MTAAPSSGYKIQKFDGESDSNNLLKLFFKTPCETTSEIQERRSPLLSAKDMNHKKPPDASRPAVSFFNNQSNYSSRSAMTVAVPVTTRRLLACPVPSRLIASIDQGLMGCMGIGSRPGGAMPKTRSGRCKAGSRLCQYKEGLWRKGVRTNDIYTILHFVAGFHGFLFLISLFVLKRLLRYDG